MPSGNSITLWQTMMTSTQNGPLCFKKRDQIVSEYTNNFHTLRTKLGIKDYERHLILKYRSGLHWYIQTEMDSSTSLHLDPLIGMLSKSRRNFDKRISETLDLHAHRRSKARETLAYKTQDKERTTSPLHKQRRVMEI